MNIFFVFIGGGLKKEQHLYLIFKCYEHFGLGIYNIRVCEVQTVVSYVLVHNIIVNENVINLQAINIY